jgi:hypothetical protein
LALPVAPLNSGATWLNSELTALPELHKTRNRRTQDPLTISILAGGLSRVYKGMYRVEVLAVATPLECPPSQLSRMSLSETTCMFRLLLRDLSLVVSFRRMAIRV